jgi:hypothetical protein
LTVPVQNVFVCAQRIDDGDRPVHERVFAYVTVAVPVDVDDLEHLEACPACTTLTLKLSVFEDEVRNRGSSPLCRRCRRGLDSLEVTGPA